MKGEHQGYDTLGGLAPTIDFRGLYSIIVEDCLDVDAKPIVKGLFEKRRFLSEGCPRFAQAGGPREGLAGLPLVHDMKLCVYSPIREKGKRCLRH